MKKQNSSSTGILKIRKIKMNEFVTVEEFIKNLTLETRNFRDWRIMSIGCTSDGKYSFRCQDEYGNERRFEVSCWEGKR